MIPPILTLFNGLSLLIIVLLIAGSFVAWLVWCALRGGESLDRALAVGDVGVPQLILVGEWSCPECGYTAEGDRPQCCPICSTPIGAGK